MKVPQRIVQLATAGLVAGALAAPTAHAVPAGPDAPSSGDPVVLESAPPVVQRIEDGFDWASAAIGAGTVGGLALLIGVGGSTYRQRHQNPSTARHA